ncbi:hypothetical protein LIER_28864 [Lithospermum erythrorhizon]|uniref:B3 domain-containing protein n=1 Tax=Lithospermum erythrorhizon TaxID=34254 RepID=A0AAV3RHL5_LITER
MGDRDLQTLKQILKDVELGGSSNLDQKTVEVPRKPDRNDEEAMKEWRCKSNVAIFLHMQMSKDVGLTNMEFDVQERKRMRVSRGNKNMRDYDEQECVTYPQQDLRQLLFSKQNNVPSSCSSRVIRPNNESEVVVSNRIQVIPQEFRNKIIEVGGKEESIQFVLRKALTPSDVNNHQARLSIPLRQTKSSFLLPYEEEIVASNNSVEALFIEPNCNDHCMINVQKWSTSNGYQLVRPWTCVVKRNRLEEKMEVELWAFRIASKLGLALIHVKH